MVNVLESLVIQLGLDTKGVTNGAKKVERDLRDVEDQADKTGDALDNGLGAAGARVEGRLHKVGDAASKTGKTLDKTLTPSGSRVEGILHRIGVSGENMGKTLGGAGVAAADGFSKARNQALALMAVFTAGRSLKAFVQQTTEANAQLGYTAQRLNVNPQRLWAASHAVMAMGGSEGEVAGALGNIQQMQSTPEGSARLANIFGQLGVRNYQEDIRNGPEALLRDINRTTQGMDQGRKNNLLGQLGFGAGMINTVDQTTAAFDRLIDSKQKLAPTNEEISNSQRFKADLQDFADVNNHIGRVLENKVIPPLDAFIHGLTSLEKNHEGAVEAIAAVTTALSGMAGVLGAILSARGALRIIKTIRDLGGKAEKGVEKAVEDTSAKIPKGRLLTYMEAGRDASGRILRRSLTRAGLQAIPFVGEAYDLYGGSLNNGEADALKRLHARGDEANYRSAYGAIIGGIESSGRYGITGGAGGHYYGKYQLSRSVIDDAARALHERSPSTAAFLHDPAMQDRYFNSFTAANSAYLSAHSERFRNMSRAQQYAVLGYAHNQGAGGALKWLNGGAAGHDAFGTSGEKYSGAISRAFSGSGHGGSGGNSTQIGDVHIHVQGNADGTKIAKDFKTEIRRSLPIQNIYGQA